MFLLHMYMEILASCAPQALLVDLLHHSAQFSDFSDLNMKNSRFWGKLTTQMGKMKRLVILPTLCRCMYLLPYKQIFFIVTGNYNYFAS